MSLSTTTQMASNPSDLGKATIKSVDTICQGPSGVALGFKGPGGFLGKFLERAHLSHPDT